MSAKTTKEYYSDDDIDRLDKILAEKSAEGVKKLTKKQVILRLAPRVKEMLDKGFSLPEIVSILIEAGFPISRATIHATISSIEKNQKKTKIAKKELPTVKQAPLIGDASKEPNTSAIEKARSAATAAPQPVKTSPESDFNDPDA